VSAPCRLPCVVVAVVLAAAAHTAAQQPTSDASSKSAPFATELTQLLDAQQLTSVAAKSDGGYVGALYVPGIQLLVVSGKFPAGDRMGYLLAQKSYKDAYLDLSSASERASRVFISDLGANGLRFGREKDQPFDIVDLGGKNVSFDRVVSGNGKRSGDEYSTTFSTVDTQYSQLLQMLIAVLKKPS
jgi:hypothetical protein